MKKICIVGGAGFIGHNLALQLKNAGYEVTCVDNLMVNNLISVIGNYDTLNLTFYSITWGTMKRLLSA